MLKTYLNSEAILTPVTSDLSTGAETRGEGECVKCQVVDDTMMTGSSSGRDITEGGSSLLIVGIELYVQPGDLMQVISIRGVKVTRKAQVVRAVRIVGGFSSSHKEILI